MKKFGLVVIGAHFGVWLSEKITKYKDNNILLVEPVPYNYKILKSNNKTQDIDLILDMIGGDYFEKNIDLLNQEGRLVYIAFLKGNSVKLDLSKLMMKRINLTGSTLRPRTTEFKSKIAEELREIIWPLLNTQKIRVHVDSIFPLEKFRDAHIRMESGNHLGKIILSLD